MKKLKGEVANSRRIRDAISSTTDLVMNSYCDINHVVVYMWIVSWDSFQRYATTIPKALLIFSKQKKSCRLIIQKIQGKLIPKIRKLDSDFTEIYAFHLDELCSMVRTHVFPMENDPRITGKEMWTRLSLLFHVNHSQRDKGVERLPFNQANFNYRWRQYFKSYGVRAAATQTVNRIQQLHPEISSNTMEYGRPTENNAGSYNRRGMGIRCYDCNGKHKRSNCPQLRQPAPKRQKPNESNNLQHTTTSHPTTTNNIPPTQATPQANEGHPVPTCNNLPPNQSRPTRQEGIHYYQQRNGRRIVKPEYLNREACRFWDNVRGNICRFSANECRWIHYCETCGSTEHSKRRCRNAAANLF